MKSFKQYITEDKSGKNLHLEHIEDEILNFGVDGARSAINFMQAVRDMLAGNSKRFYSYDSEVGRCSGSVRRHRPRRR